MKKSAATNLMTVKELADISNLTTQRIYQLISEEKLPLINDGKLPRSESISALFKFYQRDGEELKRERLMLTSANRQTKELELESAKAKLVDRALANATIAYCIKKYHAIVREKIEKHSTLRRVEKLSAMGVLNEIIQSFHAFDIAGSQETINQIEQECAKIAKATL